MTKTALDFFAENVGVIYMKFGDKIIGLDEFSTKYQSSYLSYCKSIFLRADQTFFFFREIHCWVYQHMWT